MIQEGTSRRLTDETMTRDSIHLLLIEDNPGDARLVERFLARGGDADPGFEVKHAATLAEGLQQLGENPPHLVLLDMTLPDSRPSETFTRVQQYNPEVPIIILTGINDQERASKAVRQGAQDYLVKRNVDADSLIRSIRYALDRRAWAQSLRESEERYALAVRGANDGLWDWDLKSNRIYFSPRWLSMLGMEALKDGEASRPETWLNRVHPEDREGLREAIRQHLKGETPSLENEHRILHAGGEYRWVLSRGVAIRTPEGTAYRMAGSLTDVTKRRRYEEQLLRDAFYDSLTGLPNRALFMDRMGVAIARNHRHPDQHFAVLFLDLDRFKNVNDSLGHAIGDQLLCAVAERLTPLVREGDTVARLGGDEFAILLEDIPDAHKPTLVADRIQRALAVPFDLDGHEVFTSASLGIALSETGYDRPEDVVRDADIAMYRAKSNGKAQYAVFDRNMHARAVAVLTLENDLRRALDRREFLIFYQPIVDLAQGRITAFEALVRWLHPQRGLLHPRDFIPTAEETGLIVPIGRHVLHEACCQLVRWRQEFPSFTDLSVSVNLSGREFRQSNLVERIASILSDTGIPPGRLRLELTESTLMSDHRPMPEKLQRLRELQIELHIDDFGTGYSSLNYLQQLPADVLKIDRSFIRRMQHGNGASEIVGTIIELARSLGMTVAAEGLETARELAHLRNLRCEYGQGFFFSKPLDRNSASHLLASNPQW